MQLPRHTTPVSRCLELATYTIRMLSKFPDNPTLTECAQRLLDGQAALWAAQTAYQDELMAALALRVDVGYEDYRADLRVRRTQQRAELDDGRRGGRVASALFPAGSTPITRRRGVSQIAAMRNLEARLATSRDIWQQAEPERVEIEEQRRRYEDVMAARQQNEQQIKDLRTARDAARDRFLHIYSRIVSLVQAEFPRDRVLQGLFFDDVRRRSASRRADSTGEDSREADLEHGSEEPELTDDDAAA